MPPVVLLGPQRLQPKVGEVVRDLEVSKPVAVVTAGWRDLEHTDADLRDDLGGSAVNLELYKRAEDLFAADPDLFAAHRDRQDRLKALQAIYRLRLDHALEAVRELASRNGSNPDAELIAGEAEAAMQGVRDLDAYHLVRLRQVHDEFQATVQPARRKALVRHRREIGKLLGDCGALAVAGGHVAVLLNRLRLFDVLGLLENQPLIAWSAGAMALAQRVVVFHDTPPQGRGNSEVLESGLGAFPRVLPLPHARRRLLLDDTTRVSLFSRRFAPMAAVALDEGARLTWDGEDWWSDGPARRLDEEGRVVPLEVVEEKGR